MMNWYPLLVLVIQCYTTTSFISSISLRRHVVVKDGLGEGTLSQRHGHISTRRATRTIPSQSTRSITTRQVSSDEPSTDESSLKRRDVLSIIRASSVALISVGEIAGSPHPCKAIITDETSSFANNDIDSAYSPQNLGSDTSSRTRSINDAVGDKSDRIETSRKINTDEISISIPISKLQSSTQGLGIELADIEYKSNQRVYVKSIKPQSLAAEYNILSDWIVVSVNGQSTERTNSKGVAIIVSQAIQKQREQQPGGTDGTLDFVFRDTLLFRQQLTQMSNGSSDEVTTKIAPAGVNGSSDIQDDQQLTVKQLVAPKYCTKGATKGDLLEVSYIGKIVGSDVIFDGSAVKINGQAIPGQNFGQFPPGWDVGLEGICVGERRSIVLPPVLAFGSLGVPRRGIPSNATIQYDVTLVSINGLAMPQ